MNGQEHVIDNSDTAAQSLFGAGYQHLNYVRKRGLDGFFIKTNDHWMELFFPVDIGVTSICKIAVFELDGGPKTKQVHELFFEYPEVSPNGAITLPSNENHKDTAFAFLSFEAINKKALLVLSDKLEMEFEATIPGDYESHYWVTPLTDQKQHFFRTWKTAGIPLDPMTYWYNGK